MTLPAIPVYLCKLNHSPVSNIEDERLWKDVPAIHLVDTKLGHTPTLATFVQAFWTTEALYIRFDCEDDRIVSTMTKHDDPIYNEDVVEVFISETGALDTYKEFEQSPTNVLFDAIIHNDLQGNTTALTDWHAEGWLTKVIQTDETHYCYYWKLPFSNFTGGTPSVMDEWKINFYRIDRGTEEALDQYMAWSPTGAYRFHIPQRFGTIQFID